MTVVIKLGVDDLVLAEEYPAKGLCCAPKLCEIDPCSLVCNFINLLPSGPLWDEAKKKALNHYSETSCIDSVSVPQCFYTEELCSSLVTHSIYTGKRLYDLLLNALFPALRESDPYTAFDTMDDWLLKLNWIDCFYGACRDIELGPLTPYEIPTLCGVQFCPQEVPKCLQITIKHLTIVALARLRLGVLSKLTSINWVIQPLGAFISSDPYVGDVFPMQFTISPISDELPKWERQVCINNETTYCQAWYDPTPCYNNGLPEKIYPGLLVAECIVRSLINGCGTFKINRSCEVLVA